MKETGTVPLMLTSTKTGIRRPPIGASGATGRVPSARRVHGSLFLPATLLIVTVSFADYVRSTVSLGGYFLESQDAPQDGDFYQMERLNLGMGKGPVEAKIVYGYSDFYNKRPNTYAQANRLSLATLAYTTPVEGLKVKVGRDFAPMVDRSLYFDGGSAAYEYGGWVKGELFGGYGIPSVYQDDILDMNSETGVVGGKLSYTQLPYLGIYLDGLVNGYADDGSLGSRVQGYVSENITLTGSGVFQLDSSVISFAEASALISVRDHDLLQFRYGLENDQIDSTRSYAYFFNPEHQFLSAGYTLYINKDLMASLDYGMAFYEEEAAFLMDFQVNAYGFFLGAGKEWATLPEALNLKAGYGTHLPHNLRLELGGGYTLYDLNRTELDLTALNAWVRPAYAIGKGFEVSAAYEFIQNRMYKQDHRYFICIKHVFFKGLSK